MLSALLKKQLQEIRQELAETGYLRRPGKAKDRGRKVSGKPMEFRSSAGLRISVGKNNSQNDRLTTKQAYKSDLWLHTQKIPGSHVVVVTEGKTPPDRTIEQAAVIAACNSKARESGKVAVDYTEIRNVRKHPAGKPGLVLYEPYQTAVVAPDLELAARLLQGR